jgi:hypothetical protein
LLVNILNSHTGLNHYICLFLFHITKVSIIY